MKSLETIDFGIYSVAKKENLFGSDTLSVEYFDFSKANLSEQHRIHAISAVASVCYQNPKALNSASLYNRLMAESIGLPSSSFEFVPVLLDPTNEKHKEILAPEYSNTKKFGELICDGKYLLTNYRALVYDFENNQNAYSFDIRTTYNTLEECNIIKQHFKVFKYNVDIVTRAQMVRHRVNWQELSRRYVSGERVGFEFYISDKMKDVESQVERETWYEKEDGSEASTTGLVTNTTQSLINACIEHYKEALKRGVKPEEARRIIPQGMQTIIWGAFQPRQLENFYKLRLEPKAQLEIRRVAEAMKSLIR